MLKLSLTMLCGLWCALNAMNSIAADKNLVIIGASYVAEWGTPQLPGFNVTNKGVGGQESTEVRARFDRDVLAAQPDVVMIWGHYNDVVRSDPNKMEATRQRIRENYQHMTTTARGAGVRVVLATEITRPIPTTITESVKGWIGGILGKQDYRKRINTQIQEINQWLRQYARSEQITLLDFESVMASPNGTRRVDYTRPDNSHVSEAGYAALTKYTKENLR